MKTFGGLLALIPLAASAHIYLEKPIARAGSSGAASATPPCGGAAFSNSPTRLDAGQLLTVQWLETVYHGPNSQYRIYYSANPTTMTPLVPLTNFLLEDAGLAVLADGGHQHAVTVRIPPMTSCPSCSLQLFEDGGNGVPYFQCADVSWGSVADGGVTDAGGCDPSNCPGCCDATNTCLNGSVDSACGTGGEACMSCTGGAVCDGVTHQCLGGSQDAGTPMDGGTPMDAGTHGTDAGSGGMGGGGCGCSGTGAGWAALSFALLFLGYSSSKAKRRSGFIRSRSGIATL